MAGSLLTALAVALEVATGWTSQDVDTLTRTCTQSLGSGACTRVEPGAPPSEARDASEPVVTARIDAPVHDHVIVEVTVELAHERRSAVRELLFQPADPVSERARSVGLTVALLTLELLPESGEEASTEEPQGPAPPSEAPPRPASARPTANERGDAAEEPPLLLGLGGDALLESSLGAGRFGGSLWFAWRPVHRLSLGARMSVTTASVASGTGATGQQVTLLWASPAVGVGYELTEGPLGLRPSLEVGLDWLTASLDDSNAAGGRGGRASPTITASLAMRVPGNSPLACVLVPYVTANTWPTTVTIDGIDAGSTSPLALGLRLGLEWAPVAGSRSD